MNGADDSQKKGQFSSCILASHLTPGSRAYPVK